MTNEEYNRLILLKSDLQMITSSNDVYLESLLKTAEEAIKKEGIKIEKNPDITMAVVQYAAYLFRKRAGNETAMPRFLRWRLNNILFSQKGKTDGGNV